MANVWTFASTVKPKSKEPDIISQLKGRTAPKPRVSKKSSGGGSGGYQKPADTPVTGAKHTGPASLSDLTRQMISANRSNMSQSELEKVIFGPEGYWAHPNPGQALDLAAQAMSPGDQGAAGGGGGGGGPYFPAPTSSTQAQNVKWTETQMDVPGAYKPTWWKAVKPSEVNEQTSLMLAMNTMIPYLSPEDQVTMANQLYNMDPDQFSFYKPDTIPDITTVSEDVARYRANSGTGPPLVNLPVGDIPGYQGPRDPEGQPLTPPEQGVEAALTDQIKNYYMSGDRAREARRALSSMREATVGGNRDKLGPGYEWLQNVLGAIEARGATGGERTNRRSQLAIKGAVDPFLNQAKGGSLAPYGGLGQMLVSPFFSAGQLSPMAQSGGRPIFGAPNQRFL